MSKDKVAKKEETALAVMDLEEDAGAGLENLGKGDLVMPFFKILQPLSPDVVDGDGKAGAILNSATGATYESLNVIPCGYEKQYIEWAPRASGGGIKGVYPEGEGLEMLKSCTRDDKGKDILPGGNLLVPTAVHYICAIIDDYPVLGLVSMTSTNLKKSRKWNSVMQGIKMDGKNGKFTPPCFGHMYELVSHQESNNEGTWWTWEITLMEQVKNAEIYQLCKKFNSEMLDGKVNVKHEAAADVPF